MKPKSDCGVKAEHEGQRGNTGKSVLPRKIRVGETQRQEAVQGERKEAAERGDKDGKRERKGCRDGGGCQSLRPPDPRRPRLMGG